MNLIVIVSDTFRYDYLGANGNEGIKLRCPASAQLSSTLPNPLTMTVAEAVDLAAEGGRTTRSGSAQSVMLMAKTNTNPA